MIPRPARCPKRFGMAAPTLENPALSLVLSTRWSSIVKNGQMTLRCLKRFVDSLADNSQMRSWLRQCAIAPMTIVCCVTLSPRWLIDLMA